MSECKIWHLNMGPEFYDLMISGTKKLETRAPDPSNPEKDIINAKVNDTITLHAPNDEKTWRPLLSYYLHGVRHYKTIEEMCANEDTSLIFGEIKTAEEAKKVYFTFPGYEERIAKHGIVVLDTRYKAS